MSSKVISGYSYLIHIAFAASIADPPPSPTIRSGSNSSISFLPLSTVSKDGSGSTPLITIVSAPVSLKYPSPFASIPLFSMLCPPITILTFFALIVLIYARLPSPNINSDPASFIGRIIFIFLPFSISIRLILS